MINIFGSERYTVSIAVTRVSYCNMKVATDNMRMSEHGCAPIQLCLQKKEVGHIWPVSHIFPFPLYTKGYGVKGYQGPRH